MSDYSTGKIYAIKCAETDDVYIGSTIQPLQKRLVRHRGDYNLFTKDNEKYNYISSFEIVKYESAYIELLEEYPCNSSEELKKKEGVYIRTMECVNKIIAGRTHAEYRIENKEKRNRTSKEWNASNKERHAQLNKIWKENNKERWDEYNKQYKEENKETINKKALARYYERKEEIKEKRKESYTCVCGSVSRKCMKSRHEKSIKHQTYINNLKDNADPRQLNDFFEQFKFKI
jgi:hypothetical protein